MFDQTITLGNALVPIALSYVSVVATQHSMQAKRGAALYLPPILDSTLAWLLALAMAPAIFLPAIYVGGFDGFLAGIITFFALPAIMVAITNILGIGRLITFHFAFAVFLMFFGYYFAYVTWP